MNIIIHCAYSNPETRDNNGSSHKKPIRWFRLNDEYKISGLCERCSGIFEPKHEVSKSEALAFLILHG